MYWNTITYFDKGNLEVLSQDLRKAGFEIPYLWQTYPNDPSKSKDIFFRPKPLEEKVNCTPPNPVLCGQLETDENENVAEFHLDVYVGEEGGRELMQFADHYYPKRD